MSSVPRFFVSRSLITDGTVLITGTDARHISKVLRLKAGDRITVCDMQRTVYPGVLVRVSPEECEARLSEGTSASSEPPYTVTLYQGIPKGDKLDTVVQKAVELGATEIVPVMCERAVSRPDRASAEKKLIRLRRIAAEAAKQCGRGCVPEVGDIINYSEMLKRLAAADLHFICYEGDGTLPLRSLLTGNPSSVAFYIGPEGGISRGEIDAATAAGIPSAGLGSRILRTETAPLFVLSALSVMLESR